MSENDFPKSRRVTIDLTPAAAEEVERLKAITGFTTANLFRFALTLLRDCVDAEQRGLELLLVNPKEDRRVERIRLPWILNSTPRSSVDERVAERRTT
jgi:hypothetical protein